MANPTISKKSDNILTVTEDAKKLFQVIYHDQKEPEKSDEEIPKIKVSELVSKMAFYYEKIRNTVDYQEEHLLQKNAIERILKRQIVIEGAIAAKERDNNKIAQHLLTELIRAAYLPNNTIPETKISEISLVVEKYLKLKKYSLEHFKSNNKYNKEKNELISWIIAIMASEIEEKLGRSKVDLNVVDHMNKILLENIKLPENSPFEKDKEIQIFVGIHRSYLKFDRDMLGLILLKYFVANWENPKDGEIIEVGENILKIWKKIDQQIDHPLSKQINRIASSYTSFFTILTDVISENPVKCYDNIKNDPKAFPRQIRQASSKRYKQARVKLWRAGIRSIVYIFITKSIFAVLLEVPASKWFGQEINNFSLAVNITFPAMLLFLIILFTKLPSIANSSKIVEGVDEIVFEDKVRKDPFRLRKPVTRGKLTNTVFGLIYAITFFMSFGIVVWGLDKIGFNWVSITIFLFFLAFVSFFSIRIRKSARELIIVQPKENILNLISDFFYVPIVSAGKWLSEKFARINVFVFILDFIIEAPFKIFVEIAEDWTRYVRERKEDIV